MLTTNCISTVHCKSRCCAALMALEYKVQVHGSPLWSPVTSSIYTQLLHFLCLHATRSQRWRNVTVRHAATMQTHNMDLSTPLKWQITLVEFVAFTVICSCERRKQVTSLECQLIRPVLTPHTDLARHVSIGSKIEAKMWQSVNVFIALVEIHWTYSQSS